MTPSKTLRERDYAERFRLATMSCTPETWQELRTLVLKLRQANMVLRNALVGHADSAGLQQVLAAYGLSKAEVCRRAEKRLVPKPMRSEYYKMQRQLQKQRPWYTMYSKVAAENRRLRAGLYTKKCRGCSKLKEQTEPG